MKNSIIKRAKKPQNVIGGALFMILFISQAERLLDKTIDIQTYFHQGLIVLLESLLALFS